MSHKWQGHKCEAAQVHGVYIMTPCVPDADHRATRCKVNPASFRDGFDPVYRMTFSGET